MRRASTSHAVSPFLTRKIKILVTENPPKNHEMRTPGFDTDTNISLDL